MEKFKQFAKGLNKAEQERLFTFIRQIIEDSLFKNNKEIDTYSLAVKAAERIFKKALKPPPSPTQEEQILTLIDELIDNINLEVELVRGKEVNTILADFKDAAKQIIKDNPTIKVC